MDRETLVSLARSLAESQQPRPGPHQASQATVLALDKSSSMEVLGLEGESCSSVLVRLAVNMARSQLDVQVGEATSAGSAGCMQQPVNSPASLSSAASSEQSGSLLDGPELDVTQNYLSGLTAQLCS
jgi:hypothetical protein